MQLWACTYHNRGIEAMRGRSAPGRKGRPTREQEPFANAAYEGWCHTASRHRVASWTADPGDSDREFGKAFLVG